MMDGGAGERARQIFSSLHRNTDQSRAVGGGVKVPEYDNILLLLINMHSLHPASVRLVTPDLQFLFFGDPQTPRICADAANHEVPLVRVGVTADPNDREETNWISNGSVQKAIFQISAPAETQGFKGSRRASK